MSYPWPSLRSTRRPPVPTDIGGAGPGGRAPNAAPGRTTVRTDTGDADPDGLAAVARLFPGGRWGTPEDAARLVRFLCSADGGWITGQVIDSEGGFQRAR
ncbi:SDR family oxidoreductase [Micromonospora fulviviridis]|uniref:SDR family oxidoreductase n=1 Tax=Micromonospora fulviviridis TaxID=47860 RepID=UPI0034010622